MVNSEKCIFSHRSVIRLVSRSYKFRELRKKILKERGKICCKCGSIEKIDVHHKNPLRALVEEFFRIIGYGVSRDDIYNYAPFYNQYNLYVMCKSCHAKEIVSHRKARSVGYGYKCFEALRKLRESQE